MSSKELSSRKAVLSTCILGYLHFLILPIMVNGQHFTERSSEAKLEFVTVPGTGTNGVAVADFDKNGCHDIYFVVWEKFKVNDQRTWNRLFANNCDGTFTDVTIKAGVEGNQHSEVNNVLGAKTGASWGDFNNNGYPDLFLTNLGNDQLLKNNGDGTFTDITENAGVGGKESQLSSSAVWFDYNNNGLLDLYVSVWEDMGEADNKDNSNRMFENQGDGTFIDVSELSDLADEGKTWSVMPFDVDQNGLLDLYVVNDFGDNRLYINQGSGKFNEQTEVFNLEDRFEGMGVAVSDLNRDGKFDIFITNNTEKPFNEEQVNALFISNDNGQYTNKSKEAGVALSGWGWGTEFIDYNNNSYEDLFVTNGYFNQQFPNRFFENITQGGDVKFRDVSFDTRLADSTEGRGVVVFDYDNNGSEDILISNFQTGPSLLDNQSDTKNWLQIELEGTQSNRNGVGAVVDIYTDLSVIHKYHHGVQFLGQNVIPVHAGLDSALRVNRVVVNWPGGLQDEIQNVEVNQRIKIRETEGLVTNSFSDPDINYNQSDQIKLLGNYPNPFNGSTTISFSLRKSAVAELSIYNILGQLIYTKQRYFDNGGINTFRWEINSSDYNTGLYFYRIRTSEGFSKNDTMTYIK